MICTKFRISSLVSNCLCVAVRTFNSFPLNGNIPYVLRPPIMSPTPATARAFAESPSVTMSVHGSLPLPASIASSSFTMEGFSAANALRIAWVEATDCARMAASRTPRSATCWMNGWLSVKSKPNLEATEVRRDFVWESKLGWSTKTLTTTFKHFFTAAGGSFAPRFRGTRSAMPADSWSTTNRMCVPELQRIPLTRPSDL
mmetsp:Transcript_18368/g.41550  ORF Transcript_18368/g.41550 Transcript_18368/m.41550 type:complete len:201 (+) Transcript_18368:443-1045(+)